MNAAPVELAPQGLERAWYTPAAPALPLRAAATAFEAVARARGWLYEHRYLAPERVDAHVISVGNLNVGGAGKTPVVIELARRLLARGKRVAVVSRGYGRRGRAALVARDGALLQTAEQAGDEPVLIARRAPGALVMVGADRVEIARQAIREHRAEVILLDDGFQHLRLARDEDLLVFGGAAPLGNGRLLPAGPLREPLQAARRATVAWLSNGAELANLPGLPRRRVVARYRPTVGEALRGKRVLLLAGLARPEGFVQTVGGLGAEIAATALFRDHHRYTADDLARVRARAREVGAALIVTTEKDAVRLPAADDLLPVPIDLEITAGQEVLDELVARC